MLAIIENLCVWDICFRWAGYDPAHFYFRLPLPVRDRFRAMMASILNAELACQTLVLRKPEPGNDQLNEVSIYRYLDDVYACIAGRKFNRTMLRSAYIERDDFRDWCTRRGIPLPEFWFPPGWDYEYQLGEDEEHPGFRLARLMRFPGDPDYDRSPFDIGDREDEDPTEDSAEPAQAHGNQTSLRPNQECRLECMKVAQALWEENPRMTIADVVRHRDITSIAGHYAAATRRDWVKEVAPPAVRKNRGRPRKNVAESD